ncbi:hypothetical protein ACGF0D_10625 [Kitasatospora sp. NPDC048298]|uniref:hypothetical protein n=1 Tax=Kitasatospora sp. NPDC048298 TaxID=3364049 RepID=UPI00371E0C52
MLNDFLPADFTAFQTGDRIRFRTNDTGFGGLGRYWRTGTVTRTTNKTITVDCDTNDLGARAIIRRDHAHHRELKRAATYRVEVARSILRRDGTDLRDRIRVIRNPGGTVHQKVLPPNSSGFADVIQNMGWDLLGPLAEDTDTSLLLGPVRPS